MSPKTSSERTNKYLFGGNRERVLIRDGYKCVKCGMTNIEHIAKWKKSINIDHIDGNGSGVAKEKKNNSINNLQTLCSSCHGKKENPLKKYCINGHEYKKKNIYIYPSTLGRACRKCRKIFESRRTPGRRWAKI